MRHAARMSHVVTTAAAFFHRFFMRRPMRPVGYIDPIGKPVTFDYQVSET